MAKAIGGGYDNNNEMMMGNTVSDIVVWSWPCRWKTLLARWWGLLCSFLLSRLHGTFNMLIFFRLGLCHLKLSSQGAIFARVTLLGGTRWSCWYSSYLLQSRGFSGDTSQHWSLVLHFLTTCLMVLILEFLLWYFPTSLLLRDLLLGYLN